MAENDNVNGIGADPNAQPDNAVVADCNNANAAAVNGADGNAPGDAAAALAAAAAAAAAGS